MDGIGVARFVDDISLLELRSAATVLRTIAEANTAALGGTSMQSSAVPMPAGSKSFAR